MARHPSPLAPLRAVFRSGRARRAKPLRARLAVTLVEVMVVMGLGSIVSIAAWRLYQIIVRTDTVARDEVESQREARRVMEWLKHDIRESVWSDLLLGPKFIIQFPKEGTAQSKSQEGRRLKFAKFSGFDEKGEPTIEKVMYEFDKEKGSVVRGTWEGPWTAENPSPMVGGHEIARLTRKRDGSGKGFLYFKEVTYDQDEKFGLVGRTLILCHLRVDYEDGHDVEMHVALGPRFINSRDREPFWNENQNSKVDYELFEK